MQKVLRTDEIPPESAKRSLRFLRLCVSFALALLTGCAVVPTTKIRIGAVSFELPKDFEAVDFSAEGRIGTNLVKIAAKSISTKNNPAVIGASTDQIRAHYEGAQGLVKVALEASEKGAAKAVVP